MRIRTLRTVYSLGREARTHENGAVTLVEDVRIDGLPRIVPRITVSHQWGYPSYPAAHYEWRWTARIGRKTLVGNGSSDASCYQKSTREARAQARHSLLHFAKHEKWMVEDYVEAFGWHGVPRRLIATIL